MKRSGLSGSALLVLGAAEITNSGEGATPGTFPVRLSLNGATLQTVTAARLEPGSSITVEFAAGPFETGSHAVGGRRWTRVGRRQEVNQT